MCSIEGCQKEVFSNGYCHTHYDINRYENMPECSVDGCGNNSHSKGLCSKHYRRELRDNPNRERCSLEGCERPIHANGLCTTHHTRLRRHGSLKPIRPSNFDGSDKDYEEYYRKTASLSLKRKYGITLYDYEIIHEKQNGLCAICEKPETRINSFTGEPIRMPVDHCHKTGKVRALLCTNCNVALGSFNDDPLLIEKAIAYLDKFS